MRPIRYALLDEVDRYPASAGTEGDPVSLAVQRTAEFQHNKKIVMASTPTIKGVSRIEQAWIESDQRDYFVPCPKCGHYQVLVLGDGTGPGLVWPEDKPEDAMYRCAGCRELIPHHQKAWMVERGEYRAQNPSSPIPGFRISQLVSLKRAVGFDRHRVHRGEEVAGDAQGVHEHGARGVVGRAPRSADRRAGVVESLRAV